MKKIKDYTKYLKMYSIILTSLLILFSIYIFISQTYSVIMKDYLEIADMPSALVFQPFFFIVFILFIPVLYYLFKSKLKQIKKK